MNEKRCLICRRKMDDDCMDIFSEIFISLGGIRIYICTSCLINIEDEKNSRDFERLI